MAHSHGTNSPLTKTALAPVWSEHTNLKLQGNYKQNIQANAAPTLPPTQKTT